MTDNKPYFIRALHEWMCDNDCTPYLYVDTQVAELQLPAHLLAENPLILNISPNSCKALLLGNESIDFQARFSGQVFAVHLPMAAVLAIVARENGQGMTFASVTESPQARDEAAGDSELNKQKQHDKSKLKVVK